MLTPEEVQALAQVLARCPMTLAESLFIRSLLERLSVQAKDKEK